jgi:hypothetical protein
VRSWSLRVIRKRLEPVKVQEVPICRNSIGSSFDAGLSHARLLHRQPCQCGRAHPAGHVRARPHDLWALSAIRAQREECIRDRYVIVLSEILCLHVDHIQSCSSLTGLSVSSTVRREVHSLDSELGRWENENSNILLQASACCSSS